MNLPPFLPPKDHPDYGQAQLSAYRRWARGDEKCHCCRRVVAPTPDLAAAVCKPGSPYVWCCECWQHGKVSA